MDQVFLRCLSPSSLQSGSEYQKKCVLHYNIQSHMHAHTWYILYQLDCIHFQQHPLTNSEYMQTSLGIQRILILIGNILTR